MPAGHHNDVLKAPEVGGAEDLIVPERANKRLFSLLGLPDVFPALYSIAQGRSNQSQQDPSRKAHQRDLYLLQEGEGFQSYQATPSSFLFYRCIQPDDERSIPWDKGGSSLESESSLSRLNTSWMNR